MAFAGDNNTRAHGQLAGIFFRVDQAAPDEIQRPGYRHFARSLFRPGTTIDGRPGAQNIREERLLWHQTDFGGGEGQVVLDGADDDAFERYYRSEGLDFSIPGQVTLNRSSISTTPPDATSGAAATIQGSAFTDVTGTSTTVNTTDQRLNLTTPDIIESTSFTPGAGTTSVTLHAYKEAQQTTTIEGSSFILKDGDGGTSGTDFVLRSVGSMATSAGLSSLGTSPYVVNFTVGAAGSTVQYSAEVKLLIVDTTGNSEDVVASTVITVPYVTTASLAWTPVSGRTYRARVRWLSKSGSTQKVTIDNVTHGLAGQPATATVFIRNHTDGNVTGLPSQAIQINNSTTTTAITLQFTATAGKEYRVRVRYDDGPQRPIVDKLTHAVQTTGAAWLLTEIAPGLEDKVWLVGSRPGNDVQTWSYNPSTDLWVLEEALNEVDATGAISTPGLVASTQKMYANISGEIAAFSGTGEDDYTDARSGIKDITICQNRLWKLQERNPEGIDIYAFPVDSSVAGGELTSGTTGYSTADVSTYANEANINVYPQRMCPTNSGPRFFANLAGVQPVIFQVNQATGTNVVTEWAHLPFGTIATAIAHISGTTFVAGQFTAESDEIPRTALWAIDENQVVTRVATLRDDDPNDMWISAMQAWQNDLWLQQGKYMWRYSLQTGGLFLEYELVPEDQTHAYGMAVMQGRQWSMFLRASTTNQQGHVIVTGTVSSYRQVTVEGGCSYTSSIYDYKMPGVKKMLRRIQVITDDLPADTSVVVEYQKDQDGTWTTAGTHNDGSDTTLVVSDASAVVEFRTLQTRVTLVSANGVSTPTLKAVIVESLPAEYEEFFDLMVLTEDEDGSFHVPAQQRTGGDIAQDIYGLWRQGIPVTFVDAYANSAPGNNPEYLVRIEDVDGSNDEIGEGRLSVRLRVLA